MFRKALLVLYFFAGLSLLNAAAEKYSREDDLERLDRAIEKSGEYTALLFQRISSIESMLYARGSEGKQQYDVYRSLFDIYKYFQFDKAVTILDRMQGIASECGNAVWMSETTILRAYLYSNSGMYLEAKQLLDNIDEDRLDSERLVLYLYVQQRFTNDFLEYTRTSDNSDSPREEIHSFRQRIIDSTPEDSYYNRGMRLLESIDYGRLQEADSLNAIFLKKYGPSTHSYAVFAYYQALICYGRGEQDASDHWYIESAIADIMSSTKDNASLFSLATSLMNQQCEIERAFRYARLSLDNALFFNARLRPWQIARILPQIETSYYKIKGEQEARNRYLFVIISVLILLIAGAMLFAWWMNMRQKIAERKVSELDSNLEKANIQLQEAVRSLSESNAAKEAYLGLFLSMCSNYLDKLRKHLTLSQYEAELESFYNAFDNAFLSLYPNFVKDFNALLKPESRIELKKDELLNTELRIVALIRLGITQSSHIASLLRYSVNTIYNYRSQVKSAALDERESLEERIKHIGN